MKTEITSAAQLPKLTTWAFLQPPSIGRNTKRVNANNGYVVDDSQKAGWFLGSIDGTQAKPNGTNKYAGSLKVEREALVVEEDKQTRETKIEEFPVSIKVEGKNAFFKYTVIVRNDQTEEDFKQKREKFKQSKKINDILTIECGSYIKIWVRNSEFSWSGGDPKDEYTEALRESMDQDDPQTDANKPQDARNHTWKRDKIVSGEKNGKEQELLYIGLYPTTIINKIKKLENIIQPEQPESEETNFAIWLAVTVVFSIATYTLHKTKLNLAEKQHKKNKDKSKAEYEKEFGERISKLIKVMNAHEVAAAFAVGGFKDKTNTSALLKRVNETRLKKLWGITSYVYEQMLEFALAKDIESEEEHYEKLEKDRNKVLAQHLSDKIDGDVSERLKRRIEKSSAKEVVEDLWDSLKTDNTGETKGTMEADLAELTNSTRLPAPNGLPLPIPFLSVIMWYVEMLVKGSLNLKLTGEYSSKEEDKTAKQTAEKVAKLIIELTGNASFDITFNLRAMWTAYIDAVDKKALPRDKDNPIEDFEWGKIIQDLADGLEFHLFVGCGVSTSLGGNVELEYDFNKDKDPFAINLSANGNLQFSAPVGAHVSVLSWEYDMAEVKVFNLTKAEASLIEYARLFEMETTAWKTLIRWGQGAFSEYCYLIDDKKQSFSLGEHIQLFLAYEGVKNPEVSGALGFRAPTKSGSDSRIELKKLDKNFAEHESAYFKDGFGNEYGKRAKFSTKILIHTEDKIEKKKSVVLSSGNNSNIEFLKYIKGEKKVTLDHVYLKEKDRLDATLPDEHQITVNLPVLRTLKPWSKPDNDFSKPLTFGAVIENFYGDYIWVRIREKERLFDRTFKYKQEGSPNYKEWNLFKLSGVGIRKIELDMRRMLGIKDLGYFEGEIRLYLEFAYYADNHGEEYLIHQDDSDTETADFSEAAINKI